QLLQHGRHVITQKMVQTGCQTIADDIITHRKLMGIELQPCDMQGLTMPHIFPYPCSPHLASRLAGQVIDLKHISNTTQQLQQQFDTVLIEGAGGLYVPLTDEIFIIDYIQQQGYPIILVTSGKLGSINHTILSLEAIKNCQLQLAAVIYNQIHDSQDEIIAQESQRFLQHYIKQHFPHTQWAILPKI
ncbi:MAG: dethiobiotin synthase, partial [Acinetobacter sp.]|nr:dethiobiotin synthase [Acinetobacter sp.]